MSKTPPEPGPDVLRAEQGFCPGCGRAVEGMKAREAKIPAPGKVLLTLAGGRVVTLYESWGQPQKAREWRDRLGLAPAELPSSVFAP
jgi:hypothetical protein